MKIHCFSFNHLKGGTVLFSSRPLRRNPAWSPVSFRVQLVHSGSLFQMDYNIPPRAALSSCYLSLLVKGSQPSLFLFVGERSGRGDGILVFIVALSTACAALFLIGLEALYVCSGQKYHRGRMVG